MIHIDVQGLRANGIQPMLQLVFLILSFGKEIGNDKNGARRTHDSFRKETQRMVVEMYIQQANENDERNGEYPILTL